MYYLSKRDLIESIIFAVIATGFLCLNYYLAFIVFTDFGHMIGPVTGVPLNINMFVSLSFIEFAIYIGLKEKLG